MKGLTYSEQMAEIEFQALQIYDRLREEYTIILGAYKAQEKALRISRAWMFRELSKIGC